MTASATYTAKFKVTPLVRLDGGSVQGIELYHDGEAYILSCQSTRIDVSGLLAQAAQDGSSIVIIPSGSRTAGVQFRIDSRAASSLKEQGARYFRVLGTLADGVGFCFEKASGESTQFVGEVRIIAPNQMGTVQNLYVSLLTPSGATGTLACFADATSVEFAAQSKYLYKINRYYSISISSSEGGSAFANATLLKAGEQVILELRPNSGLTVTKLYYTDPQGNQVQIDPSGKFDMPAQDVAIVVEFSEKTYTITFVSLGEIISQKQYVLGAQVEIPEIPLTFEKDGYIYSFVGWSQAVVSVMGDAEYVAKYSSIRADLKVPPTTQSATHTVIFRQLIPIFAGVAVLTAGVVTTVVLLMRRKKKKKDESK